MSSERPSKSDPTAPAQRAPLLVALVASLALALPSAYLILTGNNSGRAAFDATAYHLRFIRDLAAQFPAFDLSNPLTATTPGYHIVLALLARTGADSVEALRFGSVAIGCAFVATVAIWCARRAVRSEALALVLPLSVSIYVVGAAAWTVPDNLGWLLVVGILWLALMENRRPARLAAMCALLVLLVYVRQIHIWAAAIIWIAAFTDARADGRSPGASLVRAAAWACATLPAFMVLWLFMRKWGGLTPPRFQSDIQGINGSTPAFILLQVAIVAMGFLPWTWPALARAWRERRLVLLGAALGGLVLAALPETNASFEAGRFSGWWSIVERGPVIAGRTSVVILVLAPIGAAVLGALLRGLRPSDRAILGVTILAFTAALTANYNCWQRYHEPLLLCLLPACFLLQVERGGPRGALGLVPPALLVLVLALVSAGGFRGDPWPMDTLPAPQHIAPQDSFRSPRE
jgi:hypothetical protein